jgi:DNA gyrase subunit A
LAKKVSNPEFIPLSLKLKDYKEYIMTPSKYLNECKKTHAMYTIQQRALPAITDGLKTAARRILWMARDGKKVKSNTLASSTAPLHPHDSPDDVVFTMSAFYINNIPLLQGFGSFGTFIGPNESTASRYTSVRLSMFAKDAILVDMDIVPMKDNYDETLTEPSHFLPLIPIAFMNQTSGIATGYGSDILPRRLEDIITECIAALDGKSIKNPLPAITPLNTTSVRGSKTDDSRWFFEGEFKRLNSFEINISSLPHPLRLSNLLSTINKHMDDPDDDSIRSFVDDSSTDIDVTVRFKRGALEHMDDTELAKYLDIHKSYKENITMIDFNHERVIEGLFPEFVSKFVEWRWTWYKTRYEHLVDECNVEIAWLMSVIKLFTTDGLIESIKTTKSKTALVKTLVDAGVTHAEKISSMPLYRLTIEEFDKTKEKFKKVMANKKEYETLLADDNLLKGIYRSELVELLKNFEDGKYNTIFGD